MNSWRVYFTSSAPPLSRCRGSPGGLLGGQSAQAGYNVSRLRGGRTRNLAAGGDMHSVVIQNADGEYLGFILCSQGLDQPSGDCIFMPLPARPELFRSPAAEHLFARREAGESSWRVAHRDPLSVVVRTPGLASELFIEVDNAGGGQWGTGSGTGRQVVGRAL